MDAARPARHRHRQRFRQAANHSSVRFLAASGLGYAVDLTLLLSLEHHGLLPRAANVTIAFWVTYGLNFVVNRWFTFRATGGDPMGQARRYLPQVAADYLLTLGGVELLTGVVGLPLLTARMIAAGTNLVFNYAVYRWWTFARRPVDG